MSFSRKRSFGVQGGVAKSAVRMVGGRKLTYRPSAPLSGSYRARVAAASGGELNFVDTNIGGISISTTGVLTLLNGMAQGTTASTRIGRKITIKSIQWRFDCATSTNTTWTANRYMIVQDMQPNGATAAFADIYDNATPSTLRNISNMARFRVLFDSDEFIMVGDNGGVGVSNYDVDSLATAHKGYIKCNIPVQYNAGTAGTVADITTNAVYFVTIGNGSTSLTDVNVQAGTVRIRYSD